MIQGTIDRSSTTGVVDSSGDSRHCRAADGAGRPTAYRGSVATSYPYADQYGRRYEHGAAHELVAHYYPQLYRLAAQPTASSWQTSCAHTHPGHQTPLALDAAVWPHYHSATPQADTYVTQHPKQEFISPVAPPTPDSNFVDYTHHHHTSPTLPSAREVLAPAPHRHSARDTDTTKLEEMIRVFSIHPVNIDNPDADYDVDPRVFVHRIHRKQLVEVHDHDEEVMPWHLGDNDDETPSRVWDTKKTKVHQCKTCRKWFDRPSALTTHQNAHSGEKPFKCPHPTCTRRFSVSSNARRHYRTHDESTSPTTSQPPLSDTIHRSPTAPYLTADKNDPSGYYTSSSASGSDHTAAGSSYYAYYG